MSVVSSLVPRVSDLRTVLTFSALLGSGALAGACSATLDFTECHSDEDCAAFFDDNKPMTCAQNVCKVRDGGCASNSQCEGLGEDFICTNSTTTRECASTVSEQCGSPIYPEGEASDNVAFIGLLVPKDGVDAALGRSMEKAALAAVADFNGSGKLQNNDGIAVVVCDTKSDASAAVAAAKHLGDTLTIPVFVGPVDDLEFTQVVDVVTFAPRVNAFTMGPMVTADLSEHDKGGLVFSTMAGAAYQGPALGARIGLDLGGDDTADAFILLGDNDYGFSLYNAVATKPAGGLNRIPEIGGGQFISSYKSTDVAKSTLDKLVSDNGVPEIVVLLGRSEVGEILEHYKSTGMPWPGKIYVPHRAMASIAALKEPSLAGVVVAIAPDLETPALQKLRDRVGDPTLAGEGTLAYDATMASLLAMAAVKSGPVVGLPVANSISKLSDPAGVPVDFTEPPSKFVPAALSAFAGGMTVNLTGFSGALDFDAKGEVCGSLAAYTLDAAGAAWVKIGTYATECPKSTGAWAG